MNKPNRMMHWYMLAYTCQDEDGNVTGETMDILEENFGAAETLANSVMDPGCQVESIAHMGTEEEYEIYEHYLDKINRMKRKAGQMRSSVLGQGKYVPEISPTSIPFDDDDTIELT